MIFAVQRDRHNLARFRIGFSGQRQRLIMFSRVDDVVLGDCVDRNCWRSGIDANRLAAGHGVARRVFAADVDRPGTIAQRLRVSSRHGLDGTYDLIFMDAAKGQYIHFLPDVMRLTAKGGMVFSDNILQDGDVLESRFAVARRNRTIHSRMREYLYELKHTPGLTTSLIPIGDGVAVTVKTEEIL